MNGPFRLPIALALIDQARCPCRGCNGKLAECNWPGWRRCAGCRCMWKADDFPVGRRAARTRDDGRRCPVLAAPDPAPSTPRYASAARSGEEDR